MLTNSVYSFLCPNMCEIIRLKTEAVPEIEFVLKLDPDGE